MSQQGQATRARLIWHADTAAGTAMVHIGERAMRTRKPNRRPGVPALALLGLAGYLAARKAGTR